MEGRLERDLPPRGLPESPTVTEMKARTTRDEALAKFLEQMTELASIGTTVLQEVLTQLAEEREEQRLREQRRQQRAP